VSRSRKLFSARALSTILIVAALSRFGFSAWVVGLDAMTRGDEADYHAIATHLAAGEGFRSSDDLPTARRPPAYPVFLSLLYRVAGAPAPGAGRIAQVILGVMVVWLTARVARAWFGEAASVWAGWLAALNPFLVFLSGYLLTENLYLVFVLGAMAVAPAPRDLAASWRRAATAGALLGLATLTRPSGLPLAEWTLLAVLLFGGVPWRMRLRCAALAAAVFVLVLSPWLARNERVVGGAVLTTHGGITFYQGNNAKVASTPQWHGGVAPLDALPGNERLAALPELERDREAWRLGREYLRTNPRRVPGLVAWKLARFWRLKSDMGLSGIRSGWWFNNRSTLGRAASRLDVGWVYAVVALPLFGIGLAITRARWRDLCLGYGVIGVHTAIAVVFFGSLRTRIPVEPMICVFAGAALAWLAGRQRRGSFPSPDRATPTRNMNAAKTSSSSMLFSVSAPHTMAAAAPSAPAA
jgi:4-amino-4-deoxy-L-arabinose transferase-like glycosyltransferase